MIVIKSIISIAMVSATAILVLILISGLLWMVIPIKPLTRFYHDILGWHRPNGVYYDDGVNSHSYCKFCDKPIMQDSQGNWFAISKEEDE